MKCVEGSVAILSAKVRSMCLSFGNMFQCDFPAIEYLVKTNNLLEEPHQDHDIVQSSLVAEQDGYKTKLVCECRGLPGTRYPCLVFFRNQRPQTLTYPYPCDLNFSRQIWNCSNIEDHWSVAGKFGPLFRTSNALREICLLAPVPVISSGSQSKQSLLLPAFKMDNEDWPLHSVDQSRTVAHRSEGIPQGPYLSGLASVNPSERENKVAVDQCSNGYISPSAYHRRFARPCSLQPHELVGHDVAVQNQTSGVTPKERAQNVQCRFSQQPENQVGDNDDETITCTVSEHATPLTSQRCPGSLHRTLGFRALRQSAASFASQATTTMSHPDVDGVGVTPESCNPVAESPSEQANVIPDESPSSDILEAREVRVSPLSVQSDP